LGNLVLVIIGFFILGLAWLAVLRTHLLRELRQIEAVQEQIEADQRRRQDIVPYLLESFRNAEDKESIWQQILKARRQNPKELEDLLVALFEQFHSKNVSFLEAKKEIMDLSLFIHRQKADERELIDAFNVLIKQFPYSLASAMFGFRELKQ
jgi:hypothetical protein